ncbi:ubiquitin/ribosomal protein S27a, putative [Leishmania tarentolae]|uniref:Ubiquitin/ribosomal protein S27a, putative n=1 Tax=Leishmania tarentolae TaxID=5689 RepID=A0A640KUT8_LEITA|nr:ubiquitin/ribosomal protein S27a, putative [Leishmania tarentolae]
MYTPAPHWGCGQSWRVRSTLYEPSSFSVTLKYLSARIFSSLWRCVGFFGFVKMRFFFFLPLPPSTGMTTSTVDSLDRPAAASVSSSARHLPAKKRLPCVTLASALRRATVSSADTRTATVRPAAFFTKICMPSFFLFSV